MIPEFHIEADPENPICDFCSAPDPQWEFNIDPGHAIGEMEFGSEIYSMDEDGRWAACDTCKEYIVNRENAKLARHSTDSFFKLYPIVPESERNNIIGRVRQAHNFFFALWDGNDPKVAE